MNILVINGSPHVKGTSALLMEEFIRGAQEKGHEIHVFHAAREDVHPCIACDTCRKTGNGCVFKDGMEKLNPMLADAELVVFVTPLYYFGMSAQIKAVFDRFYANNTALREQQKKTIVLATCGDTEDWTFDALKHHLKMLSAICGGHASAVCMHWECMSERILSNLIIRERRTSWDAAYKDLKG